MAALLGLSRGIDRLSAAAGAAATWLVLGAVLVSAANATIRYVHPPWTSNAWIEVQWYMVGALVMLGAAHTLRVNEHVRVDILYSAVSDRARLWIDILGLALFLLPAAAVLAYLSWGFFRISVRTAEVSNDAGGLLRWPIKVFLPLGFALLGLQGVSELIKRLAALRGEAVVETRYEKPLQ